MSEYLKNIAEIEKVLARAQTGEVYLTEEEMENVRKDYLPIMKGYANILRDMSKAAAELIQNNTKDKSAVAFRELETILYEFMKVTSVFYADEWEGYSEYARHDWNTQILLLEKLWPCTKKSFFEQFDKLNTFNTAEELKNRLEEIKNAWKLLHDAYTFSINSILEMVLNLYSPDLVAELLEQTARLNKSAYDHWDSLDYVSIGKVVKGLLIAHGSQFEIHKQEGKIIFKIHYCASGGKLMKNMDISRMPSLGLEPDDKMRLGIKYNYVPYCAHCKIWNELLPKEWYGKEMFYVEPDPYREESCTLIVKERTIK